MCKPFFDSAGAVVELRFKSLGKVVMASCCDRKVREGSVACAGSTVDSESVLL